MKDLEKVGYECLRTAGSHGLFDVIAIGPIGVRFIQIKRTKEKENESEIEIAKENIRKLPKLENISYEIWVWEDGIGWKRQERVFA